MPLSFGVIVACIAFVGYTSQAISTEAQVNSKGAGFFGELEWKDNRKASPPALQSALDRVANQEGGTWWNGPYSYQEIEDRLPAALQTDEYHRWTSSYARPREEEYYVISNRMPYSYSYLKDNAYVVHATTVGRFPVCIFTISVMMDGCYYSRFVFNVTGSHRKVQ